MRNLPVLIFALLQLFCLTILSAAETNQPYCYKNITEISYKNVTKTRLKKVNSKNIFKKIISKKDTQIEVYEDVEPVYKIKLQRYCCEGYKMNEYDQCEPQCLNNGCPEHAKCVEPEVCECLKGYFSTRSFHNGKHICQPLCEKPCPLNSECVGPNECACKKGYRHEDFKCLPFCQLGCNFGGTCIAPDQCSCPEDYNSVKGNCVAICSLGDGCENGQCVAKDVCKCNYGYKWNNNTLKCDVDDIETSTFILYFTESQEPIKSSMEIETDIENSNDDIDPSQVFEENVEATTSEVSDGTTGYPLAINRKCPDDYVFAEGQCRLLKFASNDVDCWQIPCLDKNAVCFENGTCSCTEDFILVRNHTSYTECLTPAEYEARSREITQNIEKNEMTEVISGLSIFFIALGVLTVVLALVLLGIKLIFRQSGEIDVEGKNMACSYHKRAGGDNEKSAI